MEKTAQNNPKVSVISINYNQMEVTADMVRSVQEFGGDAVEIIVVDNASKIDPTTYLLDQFPDIQVIRSEENLGFSGGNNLGIEASKGEYLFFLNNDAEITAGALDTLVHFLENHPKVGAVSPKICYYGAGPGSDNPDILQFVGSTPLSSFTARNSTYGEKEPDTGQFTKAKPSAYVHGAAMLLPRKVVENVGMMPEAFFLYYEELDWCAQIKDAGYEIWVEPAAKVYHKESLTVGEDSPLKTYYMNRNRLLFMRRNRPMWQVVSFTIFMLIFTIPKNTVLYLLRGKIENLKSMYRGVFWHLTHGKMKTKKMLAPLAKELVVS